MDEREAARRRVEDHWRAAAFIVEMGYRLERVEPGRVDSHLLVQPRHLQQHGFVHAGVLTTMADHTGGAAASTLIQAGQSVMTAEFKVNFLRPAKGDRLRCTATVLKPGRTLSVTEAEVWSLAGEERKLVVKGIFTMAVVHGDVVL